MSGTSEAAAELVEAVETVADAVAPSPAPDFATVEIAIIEARSEAAVAEIGAAADADAQRSAAMAKAEERIIEARQGSPEMQERLAECERQINVLQESSLTTLSLLETINQKLSSPSPVILTPSPMASPIPPISSEPPIVEPPVVNPADASADAPPAAETSQPADAPPARKGRFNRL